MIDKEYDEEGRVIYELMPETEMSYKYEYFDGGRKVIISNEKNRSNHTTLLEQTDCGNGKYKDISSVEEGEIYTIKIIYDKIGRKVKYERLNKKKNTNLVKTFHYPNSGSTHVFTEDYNGEKNLGFKADLKKIIRKY